MSILTMSNRAIRRRVRYLNSTALWGRLGGRQFGSPEDLRLAEFERTGWKRMGRAVAQMGRAFNEAIMSAAEAGEKIGRAFNAAFKETP